MKEITPRQAKKALEQGAILLDVREAKEYSAENVEGSLFIPLSELAVRRGEIPNGRTIITICRSGGRSAMAAQILGQVGFDAVNLKGGLIAWKNEN